MTVRAEACVVAVSVPVLEAPSGDVLSVEPKEHGLIEGDVLEEVCSELNCDVSPTLAVEIAGTTTIWLITC